MCAAAALGAETRGRDVLSRCSRWRRQQAAGSLLVATCFCMTPAGSQNLNQVHDRGQAAEACAPAAKTIDWAAAREEFFYLHKVMATELGERGCDQGSEQHKYVTYRAESMQEHGGEEEYERMLEKEKTKNIAKQKLISGKPLTPGPPFFKGSSKTIVFCFIFSSVFQSWIETTKPSRKIYFWGTLEPGV